MNSCILTRKNRLCSLEVDLKAVVQSVRRARRREVARLEGNRTKESPPVVRVQRSEGGTTTINRGVI